MEATFQVALNRWYYSIRNDTRASGILRQPVYYKQTGIIVGVFLCIVYQMSPVYQLPVTFVTTGILLYQFIHSIPVAAYTSYHLYQLPPRCFFL